MKTLRTEKDVRAWLKAVCGEKSLTWIEAASGGTHGAPDCLLALRAEDAALFRTWTLRKGVLLPIELKFGKLLGKLPALQVSAKMRPAQAVWHREAALNGVPSFVLVGLGEQIVAVRGRDSGALAKGVPTQACKRIRVQGTDREQLLMSLFSLENP